MRFSWSHHEPVYLIFNNPDLVRGGGVSGPWVPSGFALVIQQPGKLHEHNFNIINMWTIDIWYHITHYIKYSTIGIA